MRTQHIYFLIVALVRIHVVYVLISYGELIYLIQAHDPTHTGNHLDDHGHDFRQNYALALSTFEQVELLCKCL